MSQVEAKVFEFFQYRILFRHSLDMFGIYFEISFNLVKTLILKLIVYPKIKIEIQQAFCTVTCLKR